MDKTKIKQYIIATLEKKANQLGIENEIFDDNYFIMGSGILDSLDFITLITDIENEFGVNVDFSDEDPEVFSTLSGFIKCIK